MCATYIYLTLVIVVLAGDRWTPQTTDGAAELLQSKACLALQQFVNKLAHCQKTGTAGKKIAVVCHWGVIFNITRVKPSNCEVIHTKWFQHPEQLQNAPQVSSKDIATHNRKFHASVHAVVATLRMAGVMFHHKKVRCCLCVMLSLMIGDRLAVTLPLQLR